MNEEQTEIIDKDKFWDEKHQRDRRDFIHVKPRQKQRNAPTNNKWHRGRRGK